MVDEGRTVAKSRAHDARLAADQLLVHVQSHRGWWVGEAQRWAGERERGKSGAVKLNNQKSMIQLP